MSHWVNLATARARRMLVAASAGLAAVLAGGLALSSWIIGTPAPRVAMLVAATVLLLGPTVALMPAARRASGRIVVVVASLSALAVAATLGLMTMLLALGRLPHRREQPLVVAAAAGLALASLIAPMLSSYAAAVGHRMAGRSSLPSDDLVAAFVNRAAGGTPLTELLREFAESLLRAWRLSAVELWTGTGDVLARSVVVPDRDLPAIRLGPEDLNRLRRVGIAGHGWLRTWLADLVPGSEHVQLRLAPAVHGDAVLALLVIERPADGDPFGEDIERGLVEAARRLAVVLANRRLDQQLKDTLNDLRRSNADLRASRARLVVAADAERRRIERDLHDGAQQHLVALAVTVGLLRDMLPDPQPDDAPWPTTLDQMEYQIERASADLRHLAHGIYPSLLRDAGLAQALRAAAKQSTLPVTVAVEGLRRYPPEVEAAIYFCCMEALQNVAKHAKGANARLRAWSEDGNVSLEVFDDGPGFVPDSVSAGAGMQNMADRLGAVGGSMTVRSVPGEGTAVLACVPISPEP